MSMEVRVEESSAETPSSSHEGDDNKKEGQKNQLKIKYPENLLEANLDDTKSNKEKYAVIIKDLQRDGFSVSCGVGGDLGQIDVFTREGKNPMNFSIHFANDYKMFFLDYKDEDGDQRDVFTDPVALYLGVMEITRTND